MPFIRVPPPPPSVQVQSALLQNVVYPIPPAVLINAAQDIIKNKIYQIKYVLSYLVKRMNAVMQILHAEAGCVPKGKQENCFPMIIRVKPQNAPKMNVVEKIPNVIHTPVLLLFIL